MLPRFDQVQVCTRENRDYLLIVPARSCAALHDDGLRAGIDTSRYEFRPPRPRAAHHAVPGQLPPRPEPRRARLVRAPGDAARPRRGSRARAWWWWARIRRRRTPTPILRPAVELLGFVEDVREPLARYAVFVCPILSGSGVRVKLLEAFAAGIPVVSTRGRRRRTGAQGRRILPLADDPAEFAERVLELLDDPRAAAEMAARARPEVETNWDMAVLTRRLVDSYRQAVRKKRESA